MWAVNLSGPKPSAKPTAVFGINGDTIDRVAANSIPYGVGFNLQYGSVGATTCTLTGYKNGVLWYQNPNFVTSYDWGSVLLDAATYRWTIDCVALSGANNTAEIQATVLPPPPPAATFYINQQPQANGSTYTYLQGSGTVYFSYGSVSENTCDLDVQVGPIGGALTAWYNYPALGSTYDWGYVSWARPYRYKYTIYCYGGPLGPVSSTLYIEAP